MDYKAIIKDHRKEVEALQDFFHERAYVKPRR